MPAMYSSQRSLHAIRHVLRPLRPPNVPRTAPFSSLPPQFLAAARNSRARPKLPSIDVKTIQYGRRYISKKGRLYLKREMWLAYCILSMMPFVVLFAYGLNHTLLEAAFPVPWEWSVFTGTRWRGANAYMIPEFYSGNQPVQWIYVHTLLQKALRRLHDPEIDGAEVVPQENQELFGKPALASGHDISRKSEEWRRGYFDVLMADVNAAEHLEDFVQDTTWKWKLRAVKKRHVVGPSYPSPEPMPAWRNDKTPPKEEDCVPAAPPPDEYYHRVLTTKGFSTKQYITASLAYANWLDFKGRHSEASDLHHHAITLSTTHLPNPSAVINPKNHTITPTALHHGVTPNILTATTALATHIATTSSPATALPIYLSVLRARRSAPQAPPRPAPPRQRQPRDELTDYEAFFRWCRNIKAYWDPVPYPPAPPSGDEPLTREPQDACEEAQLEIHIGEILFATAPRALPEIPDPDTEGRGRAWMGTLSLPPSPELDKLHSQALRLTRKAVEQAEKTAARDMLYLTKDEKRRCEECALVGYENFARMVGMVAERLQPRVVVVEKEEQRKGFWEEIEGDLRKARGDEGEGEGDGGRPALEPPSLNSYIPSPTAEADGKADQAQAQEPSQTSAWSNLLSYLRDPLAETREKRLEALEAEGERWTDELAEVEKKRSRLQRRVDREREAPVGSSGVPWGLRLGREWVFSL
ncbi:hypothetical protein K402DRAFT_396315 [Aulographum hederae CBS 113979]|uniref:Uncharacterized protein n=1 Tax=Aulographum hederae CBS 113979 TaxID=1176131 RepID=A0A6G1GSR7_9PEZI|nr:hypothetical protein K402DRAFT_396315 [Aulographum hederae CBS 113979]